MERVQLYWRRGNGRWGADIPLSLFALVDDEDYDRVAGFANWKLHSAGYAKCVKDGKTIYMHRHILGLDDPSVQVDHLDHNVLNNQKHNLRPGTQQENLANRSITFNGVGKHPGGKWRAWAPRPGYKHLGLYVTEQEARDAVQRYLDSLCK